MAEPSAVETFAQLIERPPGRSRRDYSIISAMRLDKTKPKHKSFYNELVQKVHSLTSKHMELGQTFGAQDRRQLEPIKAALLENFPFLSVYRDCWPVEDLVQQYLSNHRTTNRKKRARPEENLQPLDLLVDAAIENCPALGHTQPMETVQTPGKRPRLDDYETASAGLFPSSADSDVMDRMPPRMPPPTQLAMRPATPIPPFTSPLAQSSFLSPKGTSGLVMPDHQRVPGPIDPQEDMTEIRKDMNRSVTDMQGASGKGALVASNAPLSGEPQLSPLEQEETQVRNRRRANSAASMQSQASSTYSGTSDAEEAGTMPYSLPEPWPTWVKLADVSIESSASPEKKMTTGEHSEARSSYGPDGDKCFLQPDVVTKGVFSEVEARQMFQIFYSGCSIFMPVFNPISDSYDALRERLPFAVDCICMVAALVHHGEGSSSGAFEKCFDQVKSVAQATLFTPITRTDVVQAMLTLAGWSESGWLSGGHAVRIALQLGMHKAWPALLRRIRDGDLAEDDEAHRLAVASRTWFCAYVFEHQISYGTGSPALLRDDPSIAKCRLFLRHPLSNTSDMLLISTVELLAIQDRIYPKLSVHCTVFSSETVAVLQDAEEELDGWYSYWDSTFSRDHDESAFCRLKLLCYCIQAKLLQNSNALVGIRGPADVQTAELRQRQLALRSIELALRYLRILVDSPQYRDGMKYATHYCHVSTTFIASLLLRLTRLFSDEAQISEARSCVGHLAKLMTALPVKRYGLTLRLLLKKSRGTATADRILSPPTSNGQPLPTIIVHSASGQQQMVQPMAYGSVNDGGDEANDEMALQFDQIWNDLAQRSPEQLPWWLVDQSLAGLAGSGMDACLIPFDIFPPSPRMR